LATKGRHRRIMVGVQKHRAYQRVGRRRHPASQRRHLLGTPFLQVRPGNTGSLTFPQVLVRNSPRRTHHSLTRPMPSLRPPRAMRLGQQVLPPTFRRQPAGPFISNNPRRLRHKGKHRNSHSGRSHILGTTQPEPRWEGPMGWPCIQERHRTLPHPFRRASQQHTISPLTRPHLQGLREAHGRSNSTFLFNPRQRSRPDLNSISRNQQHHINNTAPPSSKHLAVFEQQGSVATHNNTSTNYSRLRSMR
jgi:hypothetical protein